MGRVIHFEIPVDNPDQAVEFYTQVFEWKIETWEGPQEYWLATTGPREEPGIDGALTRRSDLASATVNTNTVNRRFIVWIPRWVRRTPAYIMPVHHT